MRIITIALGVLALAACVPQDQDCQNDIELDELTGQITLNGGGRCKALPFGMRPESVEMRAIVFEPDADPCDPSDIFPVYVVEGLEDDLDFGPSDPPAVGETLNNETEELEIGTVVHVNFWSGTAFSDTRRSIDTWYRSFEWGVEDTVEEPECYFSR